MSKIRTIASEEMLSVLPRVLYEDERMYALAKSLAIAFETAWSKIDTVNIYANLDSLSEDLLDILAADLGITWYDYDYSYEQKLYVIKTAWNTFSRLGTRTAIIEGLGTVISGDIDIEEWYEYGGDPHYFRLYITGTGDDDWDKALKILRYYKPVRSWLDGITVESEELTAEISVGEVAAGSLSITPLGYWNAADEWTDTTVPRQTACSMMITPLPYWDAVSEWTAETGAGALTATMTETTLPGAA